MKHKVIEKIEKEGDLPHHQEVLPLLQDQEEEVETKLKKDNINVKLLGLPAKVENPILQKPLEAQGNQNFLYCSKNAW